MLFLIRILVIFDIMVQILYIILKIQSEGLLSNSSIEMIVYGNT